MIAIYYVESSSPMHLVTIDVEDDDIANLLKKIEDEEYPLPENGEFLFIENNEIINQVNIYSNKGL